MQANRSTRVVANWIFLGIGMLIVQVLLGGITRLTGSGLSITEWKPIMGALPPTNEAAWQRAFTAYQQIAQYKYLNQHFSLSDFKFIFFWEWFHRLWARLIGLVYLIPFIYFLAKRYFKNWMIAPLVILFLLGALQGAIGWLMVKSGLNENDLYVSHIRLAAHFVAAMVLIAYALVFGLELLLNKQNRIVNANLKNGALLITGLVVIQLVYGAFMAGLKAANVAPTWPDINGDVVPSSFLTNGSVLNDLIHNKLSVHFVHRTLAYIIVVGIVWWWLKARNVSHSIPFNRAKSMLVLVVILQLVLGIFTVVNSNKMVVGSFGGFEWLALFHQLTGMMLFLNLIAILYLTQWKSAISKL